MGYSDDEMLEGYRDGRNPESPEPSANRSHSYRHGFANGRDDLAGKARNVAGIIRAEAVNAITVDENAG